ncbi:MAG: lysylphosphatidylglycerol synthase transmembrane domain-containing protein [Candidatus Limnocylindrales bacterium]
MRGLTTGLARSGIGILISVVCIYLVLRGVDLGQTASLLGSAQLPWLCLAVVAVAADLAFRALRWQRLIAPIGPVPLRRLSGYMLVGYLANNILPARLGELVRSHYLGDREGISRSATLGTVVVERVVDTVVLVGIGAAAIIVLNVRGVVVSAILVGVALAGLLVVALAVALAAHRLPGARRMAAFLDRWPRAKGVVLRLRDGLRVAALPRTVAAAAVLSVAAWSCTVLAVLAVGQSLGIELTVGEGALLAAGTNLATAVPSGPGYLGTFEYAGQTIAAAFGIPSSKGLALALLIHVLTIIVSSTGGLVALIRLGWARRAPATSADSAADSASGDASRP